MQTLQNQGTKRQKNWRKLERRIFWTLCLVLSIAFSTAVLILSTTQILSSLDYILDNSIEAAVQSHADQSTTEIGITDHTPSKCVAPAANQEESHIGDREYLESSQNVRVLKIAENQGLLDVFESVVILADILVEISEEELYRDPYTSLEVLNTLLPEVLESTFVRHTSGMREYSISVQGADYRLTEGYIQEPDFSFTELKAPELAETLLIFKTAPEPSRPDGTVWHLRADYDVFNFYSRSLYSRDEIGVIFRDLTAALIYAESMGFCLRNRLDVKVLLEMDGAGQVKHARILDSSFTKVSVCNFECKKYGMEIIQNWLEIFIDRMYRPGVPPYTKMVHMANDRSIALSSEVDPHVIDFYYVLMGKTANPPRTLKEAAEHSLLKNMPLNLNRDIYGKRDYFTY